VIKREQISPYVMKKYIFVIFIIGFVSLSFIALTLLSGVLPFSKTMIDSDMQIEEAGGPAPEMHPLSVQYMRQQVYPGSDIVIEQTLPPGSNYDRYIASYKSDGLKIFALLTVPQGEKPEAGWPVIIFNHGYIQPEEYRTTEKYVAYTDAFSRNGYIVFKSDYRGHGNSEGNPEGGYYSPAYTIDVLNAVSSIKKYKDADAERIGMWGHSMGGMLTLRSMVTTGDIKAGEIWAGVTVSYKDMAENWRRFRSSRTFVPSQREQAVRRPKRQEFIDRYGGFEENPIFWQSIAPITYINDISGPLQLQHGTADQDVPFIFSQILYETGQKSQKNIELVKYEGDDHNISRNLSLALERSVKFFDTYLK